MRIAFVNQPFDRITPPYQNSIGYATWGMGLALARSGHEILVYGSEDAHPRSATEDCDPRLQLRLIPAHRLDRLRFRGRKKLGDLVQLREPVSTSSSLYPRYGRRVAEDLRTQGCDIIHLQHCSQYAGVIRELNPEARIVLHLHAEWFSQSNFAELAGRLADLDFVVTVSEYITQKTRRDFPQVADRCSTVPCGIDPGEFAREKDLAEARHRPEKRLLFAGAVSPHKGPHIVLEAFQRIEKQYPAVRLQFVGNLSNYPLEETFDLRDRATLRALAPFYRKRPFTDVAAKLGIKQKAGAYQAYLHNQLEGNPELARKTSFAGFVTREQFLASYYASDIFLFPPIWEEGFGIPPIEAMAAGLPVVASRSGALPETVREGETGFLVPMGDAEALADRTLALLQDDELRERMSRAARDHALANYSWKRAAARLLACYRELDAPRVVEDTATPVTI